MEINPSLDADGCLEIELIANSVDWHKEKGGDNILLQYINGGESMRIIERFSEDKSIIEAHHWGKSLAVKFADGSHQSYYQDKMGNYKSIKDYEMQKADELNRTNLSGQKKYRDSKTEFPEKINTVMMSMIQNKRSY